jgi:AcrR family transcriptional regulator
MASAGAATTKLSRVRPGRESIMRTAIELMGEHGYEGTSTREIAGAAGVSVAALYYHFPSKLDLLREFLTEAHDVVLARLARQVSEAGGEPRARLDTAVSALIWSSLHNRWARRATQVAWRELARLPEPDRRAIAATRSEMVALIEAIISDGVETGVFSTADPAEAARAILTLCVSVVDPFAEEVRSMDEVIELHQRFAAALADTPGGTRRRRRRR